MKRNEEKISEVITEDETETGTGFKIRTEEEIDLFSFTEGSGSKVRSHKKQSKFGFWWKARKKWQKALMISTVSLLTVLALLFGIFRVVFDYNYNEITQNPDDLGFSDIKDQNIVNIALFGLDTRNVNSFKGNSDSIMILSLNKQTKKVKIISVMRDTFTYMTYNGKKTYGKINSAYAKGGPELAIKTLNTIFDLDISEYATVNFFGMVDIIDAVGGIEVELTSGEVTRNTNIHALNFCVKEICNSLKLNTSDYYVYKSGVQKLNGVQAVAYSRIRYVPNVWGTNNDYGRTDRQRYVMEQLFNKAVTLDKTQYMKLAKSLIPCSETSLSYGEIMDLAFSILLNSPKFEQTRMPQQEFLMSSPSGYGSVVYYDLDYAKNLIHAFIYDDISPESYMTAHGIKRNDWYPQMRWGTSGTKYDDATISSNKTPSTNNANTPSTPQTNNNTGNSNNTGNNGGTVGNTSSGGTTTETTPTTPEQGGETGTEEEEETPSDSGNSEDTESTSSSEGTSSDSGSGDEDTESTPSTDDIDPNQPVS